MPAAFDIQHDGVCWTLNAWGVVTGRELAEAHTEAFASREKVRRAKVALVDYTRVTEFDVSPEDMRDLANLDIGVAEENREVLVAIVTDEDLIFGLARMWETFSEQTGWETRVFRSMDDAKGWLEERGRQRFGLELEL